MSEETPPAPDDMLDLGDSELSSTEAKALADKALKAIEKAIDAGRLDIAIKFYQLFSTKK